MTYDRHATIPERQLDAIAAAYRLAGKQPPSRTTATLTAVQDEPGVAEVTLQVARGAFDAEDPEQYLEDALAAIQRAQAADALRLAVGQAAPNVRRAKMPEILTRALADVADGFALTVKDLTAAANKLDARDPLNVANAVRDDTTKEMKRADAALTELGLYAAMTLGRPMRGVHPALNNVLPVLDLPECTVEVVAASVAEEPPPLNADKCEGTYTVRRLTRDLSRDTDKTLVAVARGEYEGVRFALADGEELRARAANAARSDTRTVKNGAGLVMS